MNGSISYYHFDRQWLSKFAAFSPASWERLRRHRLWSTRTGPSWAPSRQLSLRRHHAHSPRLRAAVMTCKATLQEHAASSRAPLTLLLAGLAQAKVPQNLPLLLLVGGSTRLVLSARPDTPQPAWLPGEHRERAIGTSSSRCLLARQRLDAVRGKQSPSVLLRESQKKKKADKISAATLAVTMEDKRAPRSSRPGRSRR